MDIAKRVFQAHGADASGAAVFSKEDHARKTAWLLRLTATMRGGDRGLRRRALLGARDRSARAHRSAVPPAYVKPFVKRHKNDAADAEAICEAAQRPSMRFVAVKEEEQQASAIAFRARDLLVRQRTQIINALRGHLMEYGWVVPQGPSHMAVLIEGIEDPSCPLPESARTALKVLIDSLRVLDEQIAGLDAEIARRSRENAVARRLMTIPGIGPITATAIVALAPPAGMFRKGRDFAAWLGVAPLQKSSGGKQKLGAISKMGERTLRRLLIIGASAVVLQAGRRGAPKGSWLSQMMARKPRMLVTVALANKMARIVWAVLTSGGIYRAPAAVA
ncbi:IS110 family transposase [Sinorhizobium meliloti]|uniref:IS110 family transposase n=1 Tax=Rhizobium meliloti TaxID=382 RepID=UPI001F469847|nr:IS110 family transposase [Sinorhizobium meliloti]